MAITFTKAVFVAFNTGFDDGNGLYACPPCARELQITHPHIELRPELYTYDPVNDIGHSFCYFCDYAINECGD